MTVKFDTFDVSKIFPELTGGSNRELSAEFARFATVEIAATDARNTAAAGKKIPHTVSVDGRPGAPLTSARVPGTIVANWEFNDEIVEWIYKELRMYAPVLKGEYRDSIAIFADDAIVDTPVGARGSREVVIMATVPYARKLEGVAGKKYMSADAPNGIFQVVAGMAKRRFGNQAKIDYTFRSIAGMTSSIEAWASRRAMKRLRKYGSAKTRRQYEKDVRNPAILIRFK